MGSDYAHRSGRTFLNMVEEIAWPRLEPAFICRGGSGYVHVHLEDVTEFTDRWATVYIRGEVESPRASTPRTARDGAKMTPAEVARELGVSRPFVYRLTDQVSCRSSVSGGAAASPTPPSRGT